MVAEPQNNSEFSQQYPFSKFSAHHVQLLSLARYPHTLFSIRFSQSMCELGGFELLLQNVYNTGSIVLLVGSLVIIIFVQDEGGAPTLVPPFLLDGEPDKMYQQFTFKGEFAEFDEIYDLFFRELLEHFIFHLPPVVFIIKILRFALE